MGADIAQSPAHATELPAAFTSGTRIYRHGQAARYDYRQQQMPPSCFKPYASRDFFEAYSTS